VFLKFSRLAAVALLLLPAQQANGASQKSSLPSSGRATYKMTSNVFSGTMRLSWTGGGAKYHQDTSMTMRVASNRKAMPINMWSLFDGRNLYTVSPMFGAKTAMRMKLSPQMSRSMMLSTLNTSPQGLSGKLVGRGKILGRPCEIRQSNVTNDKVSVHTKVWLWQDLPLRVESLVNIKATQGKNATPARKIQTSVVATGVQTGIKFSPALFTLPKGYTVRDVQLPPGNRPAQRR
jgi:hypothetical protein